jgi:hypothetical protein
MRMYSDWREREIMTYLMSLSRHSPTGAYIIEDSILIRIILITAIKHLLACVVRNRCKYTA